MGTNTRGAGLALCYRASSRDNMMAIHKAGCRDLRNERDRHGATVTERECSVSEALDHMIDDEMRDMGYTHDHVTVYPCAASRPEPTPTTKGGGK